jgi:FAD/FMN-containing dehydrogenase/Fe-S oxidoreductase
MLDSQHPLPDQERLRDDLRGILRGEVLFDDLTRNLYATDASIFEVRPLGVVTPRDEEDVCVLVRYAAEHEVPLIPRGAGTGVAGESLGRGVIVDLSRHMRAILDVGEDTIRVQPGVTLREINTALAAVGRRFAPNPACLECTAGGMLATNASGSRALHHGYARDHVESLRLVLDTGDVVAVARERRQSILREANPDSSVAVPLPMPRLDDIVTSLATLLEQNAEVIREYQPRTRFNRCGYLLADVLTAEHVDLPKLLVGSEGTLGLFTQATLRTIPQPGGQAVVLLGFDSLDAAVQAVGLVMQTPAVSCDLLDRRLLALARNVAPVPLPASVEAALLIEFEGESQAEARDRALELAERVKRQERGAVHSRVAAEPEEVERIWKVRESALPGLYGLRGQFQAVAFVEDVGVPPELIGVYLESVQKILQKHEATASFLVHAATGQVHARPFLDLRRAEDVARLHALAEEIHTLALERGGTVSTQHGTGLSRTPWVARQYGALYPVLRQVKSIFDPRHLFNPGKIIARSEAPANWPLRQGYHGASRNGEPATEVETPEVLPHPALGRTASGLTTFLYWPEEDPRAESERCNGCGQCRTVAPASRMCPIFRATHDEAATPRAKANLLRGLLQEGADRRELSSDEVRAVADLCVNCKMCAHECPAHVNIPRLMLEAKAANVERHGLDRSDWAMSRTETFTRVGSVLAPIANAVMRNPAMRWLLEKVVGVSRHRRLPGFAAKSFLRRAASQGWTRPPEGRVASQFRVAYFVDIFANYNDPSIAEAVVAVLHHNGVEVYVPPGQRGCGMAPLAYGDVDKARRTVLRNLRILAELAREGYTILCSEPTAALMLKQDALDLLPLGDERTDAELVARQTVEWTAYVWELLQQGRLRTDFHRLELAVGHHVPCHLKALGVVPRGPALLALIPGLRVRTIDVSCSGMAGTYGLKSANYDTSLAAGRPMLEEMGRPGVLFGSTECSTCRLQMEDGAGKRTLHPAKYLALAYGLMPELARRLLEPIHERVL